MAAAYESWGRYPSVRQSVAYGAWRHAFSYPQTDNGQSVLPYGNGRSYGDSCLNDGGCVVDMRGLDRFIAFDQTTGILACEAGVLLSEILRLTVPKGWFLPVTPGTKLVTVAGAIANDVHGKNHHRAGTFGCHVQRFELCRSDGERMICSPTENPDWFAATIGGIGLTGIILWAEIALKPVAGPLVDVELVRYSDLDAFMSLAAESDKDFDYTVAWFDCLARGSALGRGVFMRGNHAETPAPDRRRKGGGLTVPFKPPINLLSGLLVRAFNNAYFHRAPKQIRRIRQDYDPFFYPLDRVNRWNYAYGPRGFLQYQCVVPFDGGVQTMRTLLDKVAASKRGSFLSVLKCFGNVASPGMLSFPRPGITMTLDFGFDGAPTLRLLNELDDLVGAVGGAVYPAKDARLSARHFKQYFPNWERFSDFVDPRHSSGFWRRVMGAN
jgi:FAD/FMN-containing dehydrogenase